MQNFSENFMADGILSREFTLPYTTAREPFVDADDIADVVIASLTGDNHSGKTYELTGPELLSFEEAVDKISFALNENVVFHQLNMNHYVALLRDYGIPGDTIALIQYLFTVVLDGRNESIINDIERVLDRPVGTFDQYVQKTIQSGIWSAQKQTA